MTMSMIRAVVVIFLTRNVLSFVGIVHRRVRNDTGCSLLEAVFTRYQGGHLYRGEAVEQNTDGRFEH